jgi:nucleoid-associated protein YgaU
VKTIGKKVFGEGDPDPAAKIKAEIEKDNPGVKDLAIRFHDGKVELTGSGPPEALQKAILIAGNAMGVAEVKVAGSQASAVDDGTQYYIIKSGDTLSAIAQKFYGDANQYPKIFEANREVIKDADLIFPGQKIRIPKA